MKEALVQYKNKGLQLWNNQNSTIKGIIVGTLVVIILLIIFFAILAKPHYVPLYDNLSASETGQIKQSLDSEGVPSKISENGTAISVPKDKVDTLKVKLAAEGIPKSGRIDYSFFANHASFGTTDKEFDVMNKAAMQTELENLIASVNGVKAANVMISMPEKSVWVADEDQKASASVVLNFEPGFELKSGQVEALYHLISKSVPNLPINHIVIMDEMFNYFDPVDDNPGNSALSSYEQHREVKRGVEKDIRSQVQQMLGMMIGNDKVVVAVTTDIDFTKENDEKKLVEPVDEENMEGLQVSAEKIRETYSGNGDKAGGVAGTGDGDVPGYVEENGKGNGDYSHTEERINNEFNRIQKEIVKSPYSVRDLGIQVMVEPPEPKNPSSLPQGRVDDITNILSTIIRTSLPKDEGDALTDEEIANKVSISVQPFNGRMNVEPEKQPEIPNWIYIAAGVLLLIIMLLIYLLLRKDRSDEEDFEEIPPEVPVGLEDFNKEGNQKDEEIRRQQLEQMAKEQPEQFAKLLRSWLSDE